LEKVLRLETERVLSNDWVVRHEKWFYQVKRQSQHQAPAKSKVRVCEWEDGRLEIHYFPHRTQSVIGELGISNGA
jgi:hypothetical protein